jgi:hypothetical protein
MMLKQLDPHSPEVLVHMPANFSSYTREDQQIVAHDFLNPGFGVRRTFDLMVSGERSDAAIMRYPAREIDLAPAPGLPRRINIHRAAGEEEVRVCVQGSRPFGRMLAYAIGKPRLNRSTMFPTELYLWVERAAFDLTEAEGERIARLLGIALPPVVTASEQSRVPG